jgi:hypothetical protein
VDLNSPDDEERFLAEKPSWLRKYLEGHGNRLTLVEWSDMRRCKWWELRQAELAYLKVLKKYPEKLKAYRKRVARDAAKDRLSMLPSVPPGAPRGMRKETQSVAQRLIALMKEFENKNGTRSGAWDYATKKVYGSQDKHARIQRGQQAVRRYKKTLQKLQKLQKPPRPPLQKPPK